MHKLFILVFRGKGESPTGPGARRYSPRLKTCQIGLNKTVITNVMYERLIAKKYYICRM